MKPIDKYEAYLVGKGTILRVDGYVNEQLQLLQLYPHEAVSPPFTGGAFGENNTGIIQVYVSDNVKHYL